MSGVCAYDGEVVTWYVLYFSLKRRFRALLLCVCWSFCCGFGMWSFFFEPLLVVIGLFERVFRYLLVLLCYSVRR